ncbi:MAG: hypothetical protein U5L74_02590 [Ideonella sp.]|nr:hypothetical protein [Ideonella sp.]
MGLWGAAQAVAFGLGGVLGTGASDLARWLIGSLHRRLLHRVRCRKRCCSVRRGLAGCAHRLGRRRLRPDSSSSRPVAHPSAAAVKSPRWPWANRGRPPCRCPARLPARLRAMLAAPACWPRPSTWWWWAVARPAPRRPTIWPARAARCCCSTAPAASSPAAAPSRRG